MKKIKFPTEKEIAFIGTFVKRKKNKNILALQSAALGWMRVAWDNKLDYEVNWLGIPVIQNPYDMLLAQELILKIRPDIIIETGVAHGGSLIYYSSILELLGKKGKVVGVDIEVRKHNRILLEKHPMKKRIVLLEGDSVSREIVTRVKKLISPKDTVMVCLDSDHHADHVYAELNAYKDLVSPGSYFVVFDTFIPMLTGLDGLSKSYERNSPMEAVKKFLLRNKNFKADKHFDKFFVSSCPRGFLQKIR